MLHPLPKLAVGRALMDCFMTCRETYMYTGPGHMYGRTTIPPKKTMPIIFRVRVKEPVCPPQAIEAGARDFPWSELNGGTTATEDCPFQGRSNPCCGKILCVRHLLVTA
ncbi:hypothetical protein AVEN_176695-1 [Araneus ventricosus]|uniref:Uncharacterized protein n=1 Tax=Araneus ventricosus TaxID=182803 RepID=A0A4Y2V6S5_ARAVE|nr:hypothetical protein AVEN_176695-1 [Araneus ventricosus]